MRNRAVEHNMAAFSNFSRCMLVGKAKQRLILQITALIQCQVVNSSSDGRQSC